MKKNKIDKRVGAWINTEEAYLIAMVDNMIPVVKKIRSGIQSRIRLAGEQKPFTQFEATYGNSETQKQGRNAELKKQYLKKLIDLLHDADYIYIAGPGKKKNELNNAIKKDTLLHGKIIHVAATQELTRKQIVAQIQNYFNSEEYRNDKRNYQERMD